LCCILNFSVGRVTKQEWENTGFNKKKELFAVMVKLFTQELRYTYLTTGTMCKNNFYILKVIDTVGNVCIVLLQLIIICTT